MGVMFEKKVEKDYTHYSVTQSCTIAGSFHRPSICYLLTAGFAETIKDMESKGMATRYTQEMRFVSGIARPAKS